MRVAIDTSVLIQAEKTGQFQNLLPDGDATYYVPAHAAAEFLVGAHLPKSEDLRERARTIYETKFKIMVDLFDEADAAKLGWLLADLKKKGQQMGFFDAAIAASSLARGDSVLTMDGDYDRLKGALDVIRI